MRKCIGFLLVLAIFFSFAACAGENTQTRIGILTRSDDKNVYTESAEYLETVFRARGWQVQLQDAGNDQAKQTQQLKTLLEEQIDLVIVEPVMVAAAQELAQLAQEWDIPLIFVHREPELSVLESWKQLCYVGANPTAPGPMQGQLLLQTADQGDINGDGTVSYLLLTGQEDHLDTPLRSQGCTKALEEAGLAVSCIKTVYGDWSREAGLEKAKQALAEYGKDIEVIFCSNDAMAAGALDAIKDGGRTVGQDIYLLGMDGEHHALVLIRSGEMTGTVALDMESYGQTVAAIAAELLRGRRVQKQSYVGYQLVTQENIDAFMEK